MICCFYVKHPQAYLLISLARHYILWFRKRYACGFCGSVVKVNAHFGLNPCQGDNFYNLNMIY